VNYAGAEITAKQFGEYLINDYAAYIAKIDEFFEHDGQHKTFDERVDDLKNTMMTKEMFAI
jgi:DNA transposition AAA+ family ATPase